MKFDDEDKRRALAALKPLPKHWRPTKHDGLLTEDGSRTDHAMPHKSGEIAPPAVSADVLKLPTKKRA